MSMLTFFGNKDFFPVCGLRVISRVKRSNNKEMLCCGATATSFSKVHISEECMKNCCYIMINIYILSMISYNILFSQCLNRSHHEHSTKTSPAHVTIPLGHSHGLTQTLDSPESKKIYFRNTVNSQYKKYNLLQPSKIN
jgi:hypothetical protein